MNKIKSYAGKKIKIAVVSVFMLTTIFIASSALSDTYQYSFMFTVPVQIKNMTPYTKQVRLICGVKDANGNWLTENFTGINYGNDIGKLDSNGAFSGSLTYAVKLMNPSEASKAKKYWCSIQPGDGFSYKNFQDCDSAYFCLKSGTPRTLEVEGNIP